MSIARALRPIIIKEFRQIRRDPTSLAMLLGLPAALIVMVGYALNFDVKHIPLAIFDQSRTPQSRDFLSQFKHTEYFDYRFEAADYREVEALFLQGKARIAVVLPASFARDLAAGRETHVQILLDGSDANTAGQALNYAVRMTVAYSAGLVADLLAFRGRSGPVPVDLEPRIWYNPDLESAKFLIPGLIGFILVLTAVISTSMTVVREKERGTMEQIMVSPLRPIQVILGKTIPYLLISLVAATGILLVGYLLFGIEVRGSLLLLYAAIVIIILGALGQGLLISTVTDSQQVAFMISVFSSLLPSFLLSGFLFPVASMPVVLQVLSNVAVNKFFLVIVRGIMLRSAGFFDVWEQFLYIVIFAVVTIGISIVRMRKRSA
ncbi:MAG TPA: ABC transporter permease [Bacteroidota bacterium]